MSFKGIFIILFLGASLFLLQTPLGAQILINEFSAINTGAISDFEGDTPDWIEIYNANSSSYDLAGHFISDDFTEPDKWEFPSITLAPNERILIFASSKNTFQNYYHTNFKLSSNGEEIIFSNPTGEVLDSIDYNGMEPNFSFGRLNDGSDDWACFSVPTPDANNNLSQGLLSCYIDPPIYNFEGGFYDNALNIFISPDVPEDQVFYTTDGSIPTIQSNLFENSFSIDTSTVVRAINYDPITGYFSLPETHTYFINEDLGDMPIISISTDSCNLWSDEKGIYIDGPNAESEFPFYGANFWENWEVPIDLEFYDQGELAFKGRYDMKTHGGKSARTQVMKPLRILAKKKYGNPFIEYPVFENKDANIFKRLVLRNSGSDFNETMFRDGIVHDLVLEDKINVDVSGYRPCILFLNGTFWGIHNIREKIDEYYLLSNYDIDISQVDLLEENDSIVVGNFDIFNEHEAFIINNDLSIQENFNTAAAWFDLESFADYFITETYHNNYDWPNNNLKFWRERKEGAKWRYLMFDLDFGFNAVSAGEVNIDAVFFTLDYYKEINRHIRILLKFLENEEFKRYFINRYADLINTSFSTENYLSHLDITQSRIAPFIERHFNMWETPVSEWQNQIDERIIPFIEQRPTIVLEDIRNTFELENTVNLNFEIHPANAGNIHINTIDGESISFPWSGIYYKDVAIDLTANAAANYAFQNWQNQAGEIITNERILKMDFDNNDLIIANFRDISQTNHLEITPNPVDHYLNVNIKLPNENEVIIRIYDAVGKLIRTENKGIYPSGIYSLPIEDITLSQGVYFLEIQQGKFKEAGRFVVY